MVLNTAIYYTFSQFLNQKKIKKVPLPYAQEKLVITEPLFLPKAVRGEKGSFGLTEIDTAYLLILQIRVNRALPQTSGFLRLLWPKNKQY